MSCSCVTTISICQSLRQLSHPCLVHAGCLTSPQHIQSYLRGEICLDHLTFVYLLVGCLTSQQYASVSQRDSNHGFSVPEADALTTRPTRRSPLTCCYTETEAADETCHLTQSQYTDVGSTSPNIDSRAPDARKGSH